MELKEIFDKQLLLKLEKQLFTTSIPWCLNNSDSKINPEIGKFHESFSVIWKELEKYFDDIEKLTETCHKMYEKRNLKWRKEDSKVLIYPSGYDGIIHKDYNEASNKLTTITFLNSEWHKSWGGEILCYSDDCKVVIGGVTPDFGQTFLFDGSKPHRALAPIRLSSLMRAVLVTKEED
jgi:hypothetical protein